MDSHLLISSLSTLSGRCRWGVALAATMVILGLIWALPVYAAGPVVDTAVDENDGSCADDCSLRAIEFVQ